MTYQGQVDPKAQSPSNAPSSLMALRSSLSPECGKRFESKLALKTHQKFHSVQQPYECSICGKHYKRKKELYLHHRLHTNETLLHCTYCKKKFTRKKDLKKEAFSLFLVRDKLQ